MLLSFWDPGFYGDIHDILIRVYRMLTLNGVQVSNNIEESDSGSCRTDRGFTPRNST